MRETTNSETPTWRKTISMKSTLVTGVDVFYVVFLVKVRSP